MEFKNTGQVICWSVEMLCNTFKVNDFNEYYENNFNIV